MKEQKQILTKRKCFILPSSALTESGSTGIISANGTPDKIDNEISNYLYCVNIKSLCLIPSSLAKQN